MRAIYLSIILIIGVLVSWYLLNYTMDTTLAVKKILSMHWREIARI